MAEDPPEEINKPAQDAVETPAPPDERRWWEMQLGMPLLDGLYTDVRSGR